MPRLISTLQSHLWISVVATTILLNMVASHASAFEGEGRPNILMILVDDLKPTLGCYGDAIAKTPNVDKLAQRGMRFDMAYCNQAVCAPSRFTLMLGSHSTSSGLYSLGSKLRERIPDAITLPQHFANHGYRVEGLGKIFHVGHGNQGDPDSFPGFYFKDKVVEYLDPRSNDGGKLTREEALFTNQSLDRIPSLPRGMAWESPDVEDDQYADGRVARLAAQRLKLASQSQSEGGQPFLIIAGFVRPHLPFSAPKKYWDVYDPDSLPMPTKESEPKDAPKVAGKRGGEISAYEPVPQRAQERYAPELKRSLIHGYYASTSYMDAQLGILLDEMERLDLYKNTIVVFWSDHGYHLGDHGIWTKHTNYEQANRIPLIIAAPNVTGAGTHTKQLTESVDLYPTLSELAGIPAPIGPQAIDGCSLVPVLRDSKARVRDHAYHVFPNEKLGRSIRTERYRLVEWKHLSDETKPLEWELYDYVDDPDETRNLVEIYPEVVQQLKEILERHPAPVKPRGKARRQTGA